MRGLGRINIALAALSTPWLDQPLGDPCAVSGTASDQPPWLFLHCSSVCLAFAWTQRRLEIFCQLCPIQSNLIQSSPQETFLIMFLDSWLPFILVLSRFAHFLFFRLFPWFLLQDSWSHSYWFTSVPIVCFLIPCACCLFLISVLLKLFSSRKCHSRPVAS